MKLRSMHLIPVQRGFLVGMENSIMEQNGSSKNPYSSSGIALGRITAVNPQKRYCEVKTFFGEPGLVDRHLAQVQWLSTDASPEGDESTSVPRVGSTGLIFFVEGQAFMWGFFKAEDPDKGAVTGEEPEGVTEGDKVIATVGGNRVVVKSNGSIVIRAKDTLRTIYFPKTSLLAHLCSIYELSAAGGTQKWERDDAGQTVHKEEYRRDILRSFVLQEEKGNVGGTTIKKTVVGAPIPGSPSVNIPTYTYELDVTGKEFVSYGVLETGINIEVDPLGGYKLYNLIGQIELTKTGAWNISNLVSSWDMSDSGDLTYKGPIAEVSVDKTGNIEAKNAIAEFSMASAGDIGLKNKVGETSLSATGDIEIKNKTTTVTISATGEVKLDTALDIEIANKVSKLKIDKAGLIGLGGSAAELLDLIDQFLDAFINQPQLCMTAVGPSSPLLPPALAQLIKIKTLLATIKGSV